MLKTNELGLKTKVAARITTALILTAFSTIVATQVQAQPGQAGVKLSPGFSPNPTEVSGTGGGSVPVNDVVGRNDSPTGECTGYSNKQPDQTLVLTEFFKSLSLEVESSEDTALTIQGPGGIWCNDDYNGKNPGVSGEWLAGTYKIWVSSYAKDRSPGYRLRISEGR